MKKIGVVLSGCGVRDGSEIHEAVLTLLAIDRAGAAAVCTAPNIFQTVVVNHFTLQTVQGEKRCVLAESARIARGDIKDIAEISADDLDALIFPGGFGAVTNLCDFGSAGPRCKAHPEVVRLVQEMCRKGKPIGALCIAPAILASILQDAAPTLTIGNDKETAAGLEKMGAMHKICSVDDIVVDEKLKLVTTPAYMLAKHISAVAQGVDKLVEKVLELAQ